MSAVAFAIPGDLATPTGGYAYDRHLLRLLPEFGVAVRHMPMPMPSMISHMPSMAYEAVQHAFSAVSLPEILLVDGLGFGALPETVIRAARVPIVALVHHPLALETGTPPARAAALKASETAALALCAGVIVTSSPTADTLVADYRVPRAKITIAEPGVEVAERAIGSGKPHTVMLAVGAISPRKGFDVLVAALARLVDLEWEMEIVGATDRDPETVAALRVDIASAGLEGRVRLLGAASETALARAYRTADLFVMPSRYEGYGMVVTEALARGLPIVSTTGGALAEVVPEAAAVKVPPDDVDALAAALRKMLVRPDFRAAKADAAWTLAAELPRWTDTARTVAKALQAVDAKGEPR